MPEWVPDTFCKICSIAFQGAAHLFLNLSVVSNVTLRNLYSVTLLVSVSITDIRLICVFWFDGEIHCCSFLFVQGEAGFILPLSPLRMLGFHSRMLLTYNTCMPSLTWTFHNVVWTKQAYMNLKPELVFYDYYKPFTEPQVGTSQFPTLGRSQGWINAEGIRVKPKPN